MAYGLPRENTKRARNGIEAGSEFAIRPVFVKDSCRDRHQTRRMPVAS
jgi:hypothetical protein